MRRKNHYKFTKKRYSKRGMLAGFLAAASIFALFYMVLLSFRQKGDGGVYLGSAGMVALAVAAVSFVMAVKSLREEDTFRGMSAASVLLSVLAVGFWICVYVVGCIL